MSVTDDDADDELCGSRLDASRRPPPPSGSDKARQLDD
jgi:hypothetical protein